MKKVDIQAQLAAGGIYLGEPVPCLDIDECAENVGICSGKNEACASTEGSYECHCKTGFTLFMNAA